MLTTFFFSERQPRRYGVTLERPAVCAKEGIRPKRVNKTLLFGTLSLSLLLLESVISIQNRKLTTNC